MVKTNSLAGGEKLKYTDDQALSEIARRSKAIREKKLRQTTTLLSGVSGVLFLVIVTVFAALPKGGAQADGSVYGSFLLSMEAGGYVLVGVLAFCLGAALTLLCLWINKLRKTTSDSKTKNCPESAFRAVRFSVMVRDGSRNASSPAVKKRSRIRFR